MVVAEGLGITSAVSVPSNRDLTNADVDSILQSAPAWRRYTVDGLANWSSRASAAGAVTDMLDNLNGYTSTGTDSVSYDGNRDVTAIGADKYVFDGLGELTSATVGGLLGPRSVIEERIDQFVDMCARIVPDVLFLSDSSKQIMCAHARSWIIDSYEARNAQVEATFGDVPRVNDF